MTFRTIHAALLVAASFCFTSAQAFDIGGAISAGSKALKAATLSDADLKELTDQACQESDKTSKIAPAGSKYDARLQKLGKQLGDKIDGQAANYKVYLTDDVNAWAMANGCIRVYSGLMDMMNDDELLGVIGHEIGHVALGHSKKAMQTAYGLSAARDMADASGNSTVKGLNSSQLGDLTEKFINAQFSQSQESASDDYSFDMLKARKLNLQGLVTAFQKLAKLDGGKSDMMSSHPSSTDRAKHIEDRIAAGK
ncbi:MAG: M48 family metallopeptidase [Azonexus sp.]|jgi:putative metalloprotease|nr:M48 family metallopeptidase [Azonexus sp.]